MRNITAKKIRKSFGGNVVLAGASFALPDDGRVALIGENGSGKSTLLKIITGNLEPDSGKVFGLDNGCAYVAQDFSGHDDETPYQFLARRVVVVHEAIRLLGQSGFDLGEAEARMRSIRCGDLSGGERKKLEIAAGLASVEGFVALDEPENHLDYQTLDWLIGALSRFPGGVVFVSHDQFFIDQLADTIIELEDGLITTYALKYDEYLAEKQRQVDSQARTWMNEEKTINRLRETVVMMRHWAKRNSDKAATYQQTRKRLQRLEEGHGRRPTTEATGLRVNLSSVNRKGDKVIITVDHLSFSYGSALVFDNASAELRFGEKVVLFGPNGSGKSTLVNLIAGRLSTQDGFARIGVDVRWQIMTQDHLEGIDARCSALEVCKSTLRWTEGRCRSCLAQYGLGAEHVVQPLEVLSGGQRARFKLALTFAQEPELLILDEPTNHVDPPTWQAIVEAIKGYPGTVLAITHDREFIDAIAEKLWVVEDRKIRIVPGNLSDFLRRKGATE